MAEARPKKKGGRVCYDCRKMVLGPGHRFRTRAEAIPVLVCDDCAPEWRRGARGRGDPSPGQPGDAPGGPGEASSGPQTALDRRRASPGRPRPRQGPEQGPGKPQRQARAPAAGDKEAVERLALRLLGILGEAPLTATERRRVLERALRMVKRR